MNTYPTTIDADPLLASERILTGQKSFLLDLKEDDGRRFLEIIEEHRGHRFKVRVPHGAFRTFVNALERLVNTEHKR